MKQPKILGVKVFKLFLMQHNFVLNCLEFDCWVSNFKPCISFAENRIIQEQQSYTSSFLASIWYPRTSLKIVSKHVNCHKDNRPFALASAQFLLSKKQKKKFWEYCLLRDLLIIQQTICIVCPSELPQIGKRLWQIIL